MRTRSVAVFCGRAKTWVSSLARVRKLGGLTSIWPGFGSVKALLVRQGALWPSLAQWRSKTVHVGSRLGRWSRSLMTLKASWCEVPWVQCAMVVVRINAAELRRIGAERECREKAESSTVRTGFVSELERCWPSAWLTHVTDSLLKTRTRSVAIFCGRAKTWVSSLARVRKLGGLTSTWPGFGSIKALLVRQGALWPSLAQWRSKTVHVGSRLGRWSRPLMTLKASWCEVAWLPCAMVAVRINAAELRRIGA
nr:hypothetical protein Iba_chr12bCG14300 [Ipomoea batatas]